ncbi:hypothetical protein [Streptomyces sp. 891-h]|uniref:hypothetical protein n=1 Tax=Streptomyces sp. 891-h TaxID=2720714 RepID=UPI001FAA1D47|nr:hypothetical protein [Streptomyces sp. 891-h]UNZ21397.1 hypothetical protein HC362_34450 [Streptomyces sp. 891-h]
MVLTLFALPACSASESGADRSSPKEPAPLSSSSTASHSTSGGATSKDEAAKDKALAAYDKFWAAQVAAFRKGSMRGTGVEKYATADALAFVHNGVTRMQKAGTRSTGAPKHEAKVSTYTPKKPGKAATATISDCLSTASWKTVEKDTGKPVPRPSNVPSSYLVTTKAEDWGKRGWRMLHVSPSSREC